MGENADLAGQAEGVLLGNYLPQPISLVRGEGCNLYDSEGRRYLDLMGGIATAVLGHCHPKVVAALQEQAGKLWHVSNFYGSEPKIRLAQQLVGHCFAERVFLCNSGAEANEAALKLARRYHHDRGDPRPEFLAFERSFHGRTLFTLSATAKPAYWEGFEPLVEGFAFAPFGDLDAARDRVSQRTAAILVEPIQGEGGVWPSPPGFLEGLRDLADRAGALLIFDEVQSGMGRTGRLFAHEHSAVTPDLMTLAKALGNGIPIGALCIAGHCKDVLAPGTHASTFGGNPLASACANAVIEEITSDGFLEHARAMGEYLAERLAGVAARSAGRVADVRGLGLLHALDCTAPVAPVIDRCREDGVLVISAGPNVLRFAPPLVIERAQIDEGVDVVEKALHETLS